MCKACQAYRKEFAVFQDQKQGAMPPHYGEDEVNYKPKKKAPKSHSRAGCPENNNGPHVYVWTSEGQPEDLFYRYFGFHKYETKKCCGCNKVFRKKYRTGTRLSERYIKKFGSRPRYDYQAPERQNAGYVEYRRKWLVQHGYTREYYGYLYY